jgi:hypothetical protein
MNAYSKIIRGKMEVLVANDDGVGISFFCVSACAFESAKRGCSNVGPKFFVYQGVVQRCVAWFFPHIRCVQRVIVGSNTYWISSFVHDQSFSSSKIRWYLGISRMLFLCYEAWVCVIAILLLVHVAISLFVRDGRGIVFGGFCIRGQNR